MKYNFVFIMLYLVQIMFGQTGPPGDLDQILSELDSLLFERGFNNCDIVQLEQLAAENFEFYHDQSGITNSKADFISSIETGICQLEYKARRALTEGSLQVFPLYNNGELYGAVQHGEHRFYAKYEGKPEILTSIAKFTHLWILKNKVWKLSRVLSYDHQSPH